MMKISIYSALKSIYSTGEMLNLQPVAFDYVPEKKRGMSRLRRNCAGR